MPGKKYCTGLYKDTARQEAVIFMERILIIAEAGVNHNGDIQTAKKLIDGDRLPVISLRREPMP